MSQRQPKACYWKDPPVLREQMTLFSPSLDHVIPPDHPVRMLDEILDLLDWSDWEADR